MRPRWQEIEEEIPDLETEYYDYDDFPEKMHRFGITEGVLPVFIFMNSHGVEITRVSGEVPKAKLVQLITENKAK